MIAPNMMAPKIIVNAEYKRSPVLVAWMSPYPTVNMVVNVQYNDAMYCVCTVASDTPNSIVHVRMPLTNPDASSSRPAWVPSGPTPVTWGLVK